MTEGEGPRLRILVVHGSDGDHAALEETIESLGHEVVAVVGPPRAVDLTTEAQPDVALLVVGTSGGEVLELIDRIVAEDVCPVIPLLQSEDRELVRAAARRGVFAYIVGGTDAQELQSDIDIVLRRFHDFRSLEGAFVRRAVTERAKGVLMERHGVDEREAFELLRTQARSTNRKIVDVAESILESHRLLSKPGD